MRSTTPFDSVIRFIEKAPAHLDRGEVVVSLNAKTGRPLAGGLRELFAQQWHYLVRNEDYVGEAQARGELKVSLDTLEHGVSAEVVLEYRVTCPVGAEVQLAELSFRAASPLEAIEGSLRSWTKRRLASSAARLRSNLGGELAGLAADLSRQALAELGLRLRLEARLAEPPGEEALRVGPVHLEVRVRDWDQKLDLELEAELEIESGAELQARAVLGPELDPLPVVRREVAAYLGEHVGLHAFLTVLSGAVRAELEADLAPILAKKGLRLRRLMLRTEEELAAETDLAVKHAFGHDLTEYGGPVRVETEMILELRDVREFRAAGVVDLESWARDQIQEVTHDRLFGVRYLELCREYEARKEQIKSAMRQRASEIGYEIRQLLTFTDLPIDTLRRPFPIELKDGEFALRWEQVKARLAVYATVAIPEPETIAELLNKNVTVRSTTLRPAGPLG